jgi:Family of unknown function (DUF5677)
MMFSDLLPSDSQRADLEKVCVEFAEFIQTCVQCLKQGYDAVNATTAQERRHLTLLLLVRHVIESLDAVAVLVSKGCSQPCQPLLRSAMEGMMGALYILETDSERRGIAYQVAHAHKRIKLYEKLDPSTQAGRELRTLIASDPFGNVLSNLPPLDYPKLIANLQTMHAQPDFQPVEAEWQRVRAKRKKDPEWYALFNGPQDMRALTIKLGFPGMYEFLYRYWSNEVHAGSAMAACGQKAGQPVIRPIRHPEELQSAVTFATQFALNLARNIITAYAPNKMEDLRQLYVEKIQRRALELAQKKVIIAPWKDTIS